MTEFRGVDKDVLIGSLQDAVGSLLEKNVGPATSAALKKWKTGKPLQILEAAEDDRLLSLAITETQADSLLRPFHDVLRCHALMDAAGGVAWNYQLYNDLQSWDAFRYGAKAPAAIQDEIDLYVLLQYVDFIDYMEMRENYAPILANTAENDPELFALLQQSLPSLEDVTQQEVKTLYRSLDAGMKNALLVFFYAVTGLEEFEVKLNRSSNAAPAAPKPPSP